MKTLKQVVNTYYRRVTKFTPRKIITPKQSKFIQTAWNCRIYSMLNNSYLDMGILLDEEIIKQSVEDFWINHDTGNDTKYSWAIICNHLHEKWIEIMCYEINVLKQTKLFAELLKAGYSFTYTRDCHDSVLADIRDDKEIDNVITSKWYRHAVNLCFINKKLTEFWSRGDDNSANNFVYGNTDIFIKSVKAGAIQPEVRFLDFKQ